MLIHFVVSISLLWPMVWSQFNLYDTDRMIDTEQLQFDCLYYNARNPTLLSERTSIYLINQIIKYCLRPLNDSDVSILDLVNIRHQNFTFEELRRFNVNIEQLLSWSASVDLAERYLLYLNQPILNVSSSTELFYNCTRPWFGSRCQYSFYLNTSMSFVHIVQTTFHEKQKYDPRLRHSITNLTCYIHLKCDRGGSLVCLDWREVCNNRIDCFDGGADEAQCFEMEMNTCNEDEYRCLNGLCIPAAFVHDDRQNPDCLDRSDESSISYFDECIENPTFSCEEHSCPPGNHDFPCGDGECGRDFGLCQNGRNVLLRKAMSAKGNLSNECWMVMACLTMFTDAINGVSCSTLLKDTNINSYIATCPPLFHFPMIPVVFAHVHFLYRNNNSQLTSNDYVPPDYICYDRQLCDHIVSTFVYENFTCIHREQIKDDLFSSDALVSFTLNTKAFFRGCLTAYPIQNDEQEDRQHSSLYCCHNSTKCISKSRLLDSNRDCPMNDDEKYEFSCSLNDKYRFQCAGDKMKCWSSLVDRDICRLHTKEDLTDIFFQNICDRIDDLLLKEIDGQKYNDETECDDWPCSNIYTRCDHFWTCFKGEDEDDCIDFKCPRHSRPCISPANYTLICLSFDQVNDGISDCVGASDEFQPCQTSRSGNRFSCGNDTNSCITSFYLCDGVRDCYDDSDENICGENRRICSDNWTGNRTQVQYTLCALFQASIQTLPFSLSTSNRYPLSSRNTTDLSPKWPDNRRSIPSDTEFQLIDPAWTWRCNRGLYIHLWIEGENSTGHKCLCPPSYYGDACQYQNQRVSLTLGLLPVDRNTLYAIIVTLIDNNDRIHSFEQFVFISSWGCTMKSNINLLYSTRPKDMSRNYSVRIDAFDKNTLIYHTSWYLPIPFLFLPVNRLVAQLKISVQRARIVHLCNLTCNNGGQCMKYENMEKYFCRCPAHWTGSQCDQSVNCNDCSTDSICVGAMNNRSICVCPSNKIGPRCLLTSSCLPNTCKNNGQCVLVGNSIDDQNDICICSDEFYGSKCENSKQKLEISFDKMETPQYMLVSILTVTNNPRPSSMVMIRKMIHDQRTATFFILEPFHMVFVKIINDYYLAVVQQYSTKSISTSIDPTQRCIPITELFDSSLLTLARIRRVKYYHLLCRNRTNMSCFYDEMYMCLCTMERHANCFDFDRNTKLQCQHSDYCQNGASCFQDHPTCPSSTICICTDCYFGNQCQFYAKGFGLTLDDILRYEIQPELMFSQQRISIKVSTAVTMLMFAFGLVNGIFSYLTFRRINCQQVGCGLYLFASSITSLLTLTMFTVKFWFLVLSQMDFITNGLVLHLGCVIIEPLLKVLLYTDNWLSGCVAIERALTVFKGLNFQKAKSKRIAKWIIFTLPILIIITIIHEPIYRDLFDDEEEHRTWCVTHYSRFLQVYNSAIILFHFLMPFIINLFSAIFIIVNAARHRSVSQTRQSYLQHLHEQFAEHKHILISTIALVILSLPRLIISLISSCTKSSRNPWLYLVGYFISFIPSVLIFIVFVLPSDLYSNEFKAMISSRRSTKRHHT